MSKHAYNLNADAAKRVGSLGQIKTTGAYTGVFTRAEAVESKNGTLGIEFDFVADDGRPAKFLTVWTLNSSGEELPGRRMIDAIMCVAKTRSIQPSKQLINKWDSAARGEVRVAAEVFVDLMNKPVGVILQREFSTYNGELKDRVNLFGCFDANTRQTPREILEKQPAAALDYIVAGVADKWSDDAKRMANGSAPSAGSAAKPNTDDDNFDDDIPF